MLKLQYVGRGMHLEFRHPEYPTPIVTSPIQEIRDYQTESELAALRNQLLTPRHVHDP